MDQLLLKSYIETNYRVLHPRIDIRINEINDLLDQLLMDNYAFCWAFISAENPRSVLLTESENQMLYQNLLTKIKAEGYSFCEGLGIGDNGDWPAEKSLLVLDIDHKEAKTIALEFDQNAIVIGQLGQKAQLLICQPTK